jgi:hypothetical protein
MTATARPIHNDAATARTIKCEIIWCHRKAVYRIQDGTTETYLAMRACRKHASEWAIDFAMRGFALADLADDSKEESV